MSALEARLVISGKDESAGSIESVRKHIAELDKSIATFDKLMTATSKVAKATDPMATALNEAQRAFMAQRETLVGVAAGLDRVAGASSAVASAESRLRSEIERTNSALANRGKEVRSQVEHGGFRNTVHELAPWAGPGILEATKKAAMSGAELQHSNTQLAKLNLSPEDISAINDRALALSTKYGNITQAAGVDMFKELRSVVTTPSEALAVLDPIMAAASVLNASDPSGEMSKNLTDLVKGAENLGAAKDPARLVKLIDGWTKAMQVMGHTINPEGVYEFDKYTRAAGASLSDRFLMTTGMSLSQEMGGSSAGNSMAMLYSQLAGGFQNSHGALKEFVRLGLIGANDVDYLKNGEAKQLKTGVKPKWLNQAMHDPDYFLWDTVLPALAKKGITKPEDVLPELRRLFPNRSESDAMTKLFVQREQYAAHASMYENATGLAGAALNRDDAIAELSALGAQLQTFAGVLTSPIMKDAGHALAAMADQVGAWSKNLAAFDKNHPDASKAIAGGSIATGLGVGGWLTAKLLGAIGGKLFGSGAGAGGAGAGAAPGALPGAGGASWLSGMFNVAAPIATLMYEKEIKENLINPLLAHLFGPGGNPNVVPAMPSWRFPTNTRSTLGYLNNPDLQGIGNEASAGQVRLDPNSKVEVVVRVEASSELLRVLANAKASGSAEATVGRMDSSAAPARRGTWDR
jgi:hypothetical protein